MTTSRCGSLPARNIDGRVSEAGFINRPQLPRTTFLASFVMSHANTDPGLKLVHIGHLATDVVVVAHLVVAETDLEGQIR